jgi:hypothetical protein
MVAQTTETQKNLRYNDYNGLFSCYASGQNPVALYYKSNGGAKIAIDPQIIASDISNISDAGVTNATANIVVRGIASVTATPDGTVVTAASVSGNVLTYTVAANSGEARDGSIKISGGGVEKTVTVSQLAKPSENTKTASIDLSAQNYSNAEEVSSVTINEDISVEFNKGSNSNAPKYYNDGKAVRVYGGSYFTVTAKQGYTITNIELSFGSGDKTNTISADTGTYSGNTWSGSANSVKLTVDGTSGQRRIKTIEVSYTTE